MEDFRLREFLSPLPLWERSDRVVDAIRERGSH
jgi:hypothetical protein